MSRDSKASLAGQPGASGWKMRVLPPLTAESSMPRYFITTSDHIRAEDNEGSVLTDRAAVRTLLRETLIAILQDEGLRTGVDEFTAEARDGGGRCVMRAKISFVVADQ